MILVLVGLWQSCAQTGSLSGGDKDETPPYPNCTLLFFKKVYLTPLYDLDYFPFALHNGNHDALKTLIVRKDSRLLLVND